MKPHPRLASSAVLLGAGALLGSWLAVPATPLSAQAAAEVPIDLSEATAEKVKAASNAVAAAQATLEQEGLYKPAVRGANAYAVLCGGLDAIADLEGGRGVDPITFAGLHAGLAIDDVATLLAFDATGRLTYNGKLVRIYSIERMRNLVERQKAVLEASEGGRKISR